MDESDMSHLERKLIATKQAGNTYLHATLTKFLFKWTLLTFIYATLWILTPLVKWGLLLLTPLFSFSLYQIYLQKRQFQQKIEAMEALIEEVKNIM